MMFEELAAAVTYRSIGPTRGGQCVTVTGDPTNAQIFYFGTTGGGVWKTTDGGHAWHNTSDGYFTRASVGALALAPSDPNVLYAGMGETTIRGNVSHGDGVYKTTDGGATWQHCGLAETRNIGRVRIHPTNPDVVFVAAFGHAHGPHPARGIYRSTDGGANWQLVLHRDENTGANEVFIDPNNPRTIYAALWEARRGPYYLLSGGAGSGLFKSTDSGETWTEISRNPGLPKGLLGKCEISVSAAQSGRVYAIIEAADNGSGVYRSDDSGATWTKTADDVNLLQRAWYFNHLCADPQDADTLWVLNFELWKSTNAGRTFDKIPAGHPDHHDMWIDPHDSRRLILGNDNGGTVSYTGGNSWSTQYNQTTAEFYHVATDTRTPYRVYGAQQDNSTMSVPSRSPETAIGFSEWDEIGGGESGYVAVRPDNPNIVYSAAQTGYLTRYDRTTGQTRDITVWPENVRGYGADGYKYRFNWTFPIVLSPHDPNTLYVTSQVVHRSTDEGNSWDILSPDLTRADPTTMGQSGGPINLDNTGAEIYATIFTFAESPVQRGVFWAGSDDGLVHVSRDGGTSWRNVTPPGLPEWALMSMIEASPFDAGTAYLAATRYKTDDFAPYIYKTADFGQTWTRITEGIPGNVFARVVRCDPAQPGLLYAGTETGVYVSPDDGAHWHRMHGANLPVVPIHDMVVTQGDLVLGTHGRSFWILDDLSPVRQAAANRDATATAFLAAPRDTIRWPSPGGWNGPPQAGTNYVTANGQVTLFHAVTNAEGDLELTGMDAKQNPPDGVLVHYYLATAPEGGTTLRFRDAAGAELRVFTNETEKKAPAKAGWNRFVWNLRATDATNLDAKGGDQPSIAGPAVPPGSYTVELTAGGATHTAGFRVVPDPRLATTQADYDAQYALGCKVRDSLGAVNTMINDLRRMRGRVAVWTAWAGDDHADITAKAKTLNDKLDALEDELIAAKANSPKDTLKFPVRLNSKFGKLMGVIYSADAAPTTQTYAVYDALAAQLGEVRGELGAIREKESPALAAEIAKASLPPLG